MIYYMYKLDIPYSITNIIKKYVLRLGLRQNDY
jgi:hypothetical protein